MRALLIAALLVLVGAPVARADRWPAASVEHAITVADNHWPDSPCHGRQQLTWETGAQLDASIPGIEPGLAMAMANGPSDCQVWVAWDRPDNLSVLCSVLMHEFGHNAGLGHSTDPSSPMYPVLTRQPECTAVFAPRHWRRHRSWTWR